MAKDMPKDAGGSMRKGVANDAAEPRQEAAADAAEPRQDAAAGAAGQIHAQRHTQIDAAQLGHAGLSPTDAEDLVFLNDLDRFGRSTSLAEALGWHSDAKEPTIDLIEFHRLVVGGA